MSSGSDFPSFSVSTRHGDNRPFDGGGRFLPPFLSSFPPYVKSPFVRRLRSQKRSTNGRREGRTSVEKAEVVEKDPFSFFFHIRFYSGK